MRPPVACSHWSASGAERGIAPESEKWIEDKSAFVPSAAASRRSYMGGTPRKNVHGRRR